MSEASRRLLKYREFHLIYWAIVIATLWRLFAFVCSSWEHAARKMFSNWYVTTAESRQGAPPVAFARQSLNALINPLQTGRNAFSSSPTNSLPHLRERRRKVSNQNETVTGLRYSRIATCAPVDCIYVLSPGDSPLHRPPPPTCNHCTQSATNANEQSASVEANHTPPSIGNSWLVLFQLHMASSCHKRGNLIASKCILSNFDSNIFQSSS